MSPYVYCAGNPVNLVDPTGMSFDVTDNTKEDQKTFNDAVEKLIEKGGKIGRYIKKLRDSKKYTIKVYMNRNNNNYFYWLKKELYWDPESAYSTDNECLLTPIVILSHEMRHAYDYCETPSIYYALQLKESTYEGAYSALEDNAIESETEAAKLWGLVPSSKKSTRKQYGKMESYKVESPYSLLPPMVDLYIKAESQELPFLLDLSIEINNNNSYETKKSFMRIFRHGK